MSIDYASYYQNQQIETAANNRATQAYNASKAAGEAEDRALQRAQFEWKKTFEESGLTGQYKGDWTQPVKQWQAETFGTWGAPQAGQETMAREQQTFGQGQGLAAMYGQYYAPGQAPAAGTQTQTAQEQQYTQWLRAQQQALAEQTQQQKTANEYLTLLSGMRGPQNYFQYQNVLGSTPGGMRDLVGAAMGQFVPGGGATTGVQPTPQSLQGLYGDVMGGPTNPMAFSPGGQQQQQSSRWGAVSGTGQQTATPGQFNEQIMQAFTPGGQQQSSRWGPVSGTGQQTADPNQFNTQQFQPGQYPTQQQNAAGNGTNTMGAGQAQANQLNLPAPNQVAAQSWKNLAPSQQQLMTSGWEAQGWNADDVKSLMAQSLPKYGTNAASAGTWRLR